MRKNSRRSFLEVAAVDFEVDEEPDFCSLFFSLVPLWLAGVGFVFLLSLLETTEFSDFTAAVRDESAVFLCAILFSMGSPYILLKARSSFSERCRSSLSERSKPTRIPLCTLVPGCDALAHNVSDTGGFYTQSHAFEAINRIAQPITDERGHTLRGCFLREDDAFVFARIIAPHDAEAVTGSP